MTAFTNSHKTIQKYILKEFLISFAVSFLFFFFIFFINQILLIAKNILLKNVSVPDLLRIILYSIPVILAFTFPFSTLSGSAMALGKLSSQLEIFSMRAGGISYRKIFLPLIFTAVIFSLASFIINDVFLPLSTIQYKNLYKELLYKAPALEIEPYSSTKYSRRIIINKDITDDVIEDVIIIHTDDPYTNREIVRADSATLKRSDSRDSFILKLQDASSTKTKSAEGDFEFFTAESMSLYFFMQSLSFNMLSTAPSEMSFLDVYSEIIDKRKSIRNAELENDRKIAEERYVLFQKLINGQKRLDDAAEELEVLRSKEFVTRTYTYYQIELFKKAALPLGCLFLLFLSFPVSTAHFQYGRIIGFGIGVLLSTLYWALLFAGQTFGVRTDIHPFLLMFFPNFLLGGLGILFFLLLKNR